MIVQSWGYVGCWAVALYSTEQIVWVLTFHICRIYEVQKVRIVPTSIWLCGSSFCGNGTYLWEAWRDHGLTHCFMDTVSSSVLFGFIFIFGGAQILVYRKYSTILETRWQPRSWLYNMQILLCVLMSIESIIHFSLEVTVIGNKTVYVYNIMSACMVTLAWPIAIAVTCLERKRLLPSIPTRGHGLVLLVFWSVAFIIENVAFISWFSDDWWWQNRE